MTCPFHNPVIFKHFFLQNKKRYESVKSTQFSIQHNIANNFYKVIKILKNQFLPRKQDISFITFIFDQKNVQRYCC